MMRLINTLILITLTVLVSCPILIMIKWLVGHEQFHWFWTTGGIALISTLYFLGIAVLFKSMFLALWRRSVMNYVIAFFGLIWMIVATAFGKRW